MDLFENKRLKLAISGERNHLTHEITMFFESRNISFEDLSLSSCIDSNNLDISSLMLKLQGVHSIVHQCWTDDFLLSYESSFNFKKQLRLLKAILKAAQLSNVKRIVLTSFLGIESSKDKMYLLEKIVLNSDLEEKIIIRLPMVEVSKKHRNLVYKRCKFLTSFPFLVQKSLLSRKFLFFTSKDIVSFLLNVLTKQLQHSALVIPVLSPKPLSLAQYLNVIQEENTKKDCKDTSIKAIFVSFCSNIASLFLYKSEVQDFQKSLYSYSYNPKRYNKKYFNNFDVF